MNVYLVQRTTPYDSEEVIYVTSTMELAITKAQELLQELCPESTIKTNIEHDKDSGWLAHITSKDKYAFYEMKVIEMTVMGE